jgi:hypothetical protein
MFFNCAVAGRSMPSPPALLLLPLLLLPAAELLLLSPPITNETLRPMCAAASML